MTTGQSRRNTLVEAAVGQILTRVDQFILGARLVLPKHEFRKACDLLLDRQRASVKTAALFFSFYALEDPAWDWDSVPVGSRGVHGDKRLSEELARRDITLHGNITAFAENLGSKGNVRNFRLSTDPRFKDFVAGVGHANAGDRVRIADYLAFRFAESKAANSPLPPVGAEVLTFVRARALFYRLLALPSEGHVQQFLIAALLFVLRQRQGIEVSTHHPHAADAYANAAGDIEERREGLLIRAYEVTVRDDWQNRISDFKRKMDQFGLSKYVIVAARINEDDEWPVPANMALALEPYGRDIAVVDIRDVINFLAAELAPDELRAAVNRAYEFLSSPRLSGRDDFKRAYVEVVRSWLDGIEGEPE